MLGQIQPYLSIISITIAICSLIYNLIQYRTSRQEKLALRSLVQGDYNIYYHIARQCSRIRIQNQNREKKNHEAINAIEVIRGCADAARTHLISYSREHLKYIPYYEHPAAPDKPQAQEIMDGMTPELYRRNLKRGKKNNK
jgi:hypothetical protein